ncbi:hypothetical protein VN1169_07940 [Helicobacter pylori]|nr:hypothetical protein VN1169_07940 [Helicobacter pylori]
MGSIGSMGKPIEGFLVAAIQFPVPIVNSRKDIDHNLKALSEPCMRLKRGIREWSLSFFLSIARKV